MTMIAVSNARSARLRSMLNGEDIFLMKDAHVIRTQLGKAIIEQYENVEYYKSQDERSRIIRNFCINEITEKKWLTHIYDNFGCHD